MTRPTTSNPPAGTRAHAPAPATIGVDALADPGTASAGRDPVGLLIEQAATRVPELVPLRYGRMLASPFSFFRGAAAVMAADLAGAPVSGPTVQLCGDAHLLNFGAFASPERHLVFDVNDFDETLPGPWEWDVKRLVASLAVAGRQNGFSRKQRRAVMTGAVTSYRSAVAEFAGQGNLAVWYAHVNVDQLAPILGARLSKSRRRRLDRGVTKARTRDGLRSLAKLTAVVDGRRRIVPDPPLVVPIHDLFPHLAAEAVLEEVRRLLARYRRGMQPDRRHLLDSYRLVDVARKVVGVGSVGTRAWIALLSGRDDGDPLLLQAKEAQPSVLAGRQPAAVRPRPPANQGQRVVTGQRMMQAASDIFLGWASITGVDGVERSYYLRQLRDWKQTPAVHAMDPDTMAVYAQLCGWTLARAHARSGDRVALAAHLDRGGPLEEALVEFGEGYADQTERDHAALVEAVRTGRVEAVPDR